MQVFAIRTSFRVELIIWSLILILVGRAVNIFPLSFLVNRFRSIKISSRMQFIMWFSGEWSCGSVVSGHVIVPWSCEPSMWWSPWIQCQTLKWYAVSETSAGLKTPFLRPYSNLNWPDFVMRFYRLVESRSSIYLTCIRVKVHCWCARLGFRMCCIAGMKPALVTSPTFLSASVGLCKLIVG